MRFATILSLLMLEASLLASTAAADFPVSDCGTTVPAGEIGVLQNDLACGDIGGLCFSCTEHRCTVAGTCSVDADCATSLCWPLPAVMLGQGAALDMNGHAIRSPGRSAVLCGPFKVRRCAVYSSTGRGEITEATIGIHAQRARIGVKNVDVHDCTGQGIHSIAVAKLTDVTANRNLIGIAARTVIAQDVEASSNGAGIAAAFTILGDPRPPFGRVIGRDIIANDNAQFGILSAQAFLLDRVTATGNGWRGGPDSAGITGYAGGTLLRSVVTGNVHGPAATPLDVFTAAPPRLVGTTCEHSAKYPAAASSWGVCSLD